MLVSCGCPRNALIAIAPIISFSFAPRYLGPIDNHGFYLMIGPGRRSPMKALVTTVLLLLHVQSAWADCADLNRQAIPRSSRSARPRRRAGRRPASPAPERDLPSS